MSYIQSYMTPWDAAVRDGRAYQGWHAATFSRVLSNSFQGGRLYFQNLNSSTIVVEGLHIDGEGTIPLRLSGFGTYTPPSPSTANMELITCTNASLGETAWAGEVYYQSGNNFYLAAQPSGTALFPGVQEYLDDADDRGVEFQMESNHAGMEFGEPKYEFVGGSSTYPNGVGLIKFPHLKFQTSTPFWIEFYYLSNIDFGVISFDFYVVE